MRNQVNWHLPIESIVIFFTHSNVLEFFSSDWYSVSEPALELQSRTAPSVEAHHHFNGPDIGYSFRSNQRKFWNLEISVNQLHLSVSSKNRREKWTRNVSRNKDFFFKSKTDFLFGLNIYLVNDNIQTFCCPQV